MAIAWLLNLLCRLESLIILRQESILEDFLISKTDPRFQSAFFCLFPLPLFFFLIKV